MRTLTLLGSVGLAACQEYTIYDPLDFTASSNPPALSTPQVTDVIRQGVSPLVDVLWVLDNSGSMAEEQTKLSENLFAFHDFLRGSGLDWHVGITTTDVDAGLGGALEAVAGYGYLYEDVPHNDELFQMAVRVGVQGSADERGLAATWLSLTQPDPGLVAANRGFYREDAALHIVVVSDEEDQSEDWVSTWELIGYLRNLKADPEIPVTFSSIVGPEPSGCRNRETDAVAGSRYLDVTRGVGGIEASICEEDWVPILQELGLQASGQRQEFFLSKVPDLESLDVHVVSPHKRWYGVPVATIDEVDAACEAAGKDLCVGYEYDPYRNSVVLVGLVPGKNAEVRIRYEEGGGYY